METFQSVIIKVLKYKMKTYSKCHNKSFEI